MLKKLKVHVKILKHCKMIVYLRFGVGSNQNQYSVTKLNSSTTTLPKPPSSCCAQLRFLEAVVSLNTYKLSKEKAQVQLTEQICQVSVYSLGKLDF